MAQSLHGAGENDNPLWDLRRQLDDAPTVEDKIRTNLSLSDAERQQHLNRIHSNREAEAALGNELADEENPGVVRRIAEGLYEQGSELVHHPLRTIASAAKTIVTAPAESEGKILAPSLEDVAKHEEDPTIRKILANPKLSADERLAHIARVQRVKQEISQEGGDEFAATGTKPSAEQAAEMGRFGIASHPVPVSGKARAAGVAQALATIVAPEVGPTAAGALLGASYNPDDPLVGAGEGAVTGKVLGEAGKTVELERARAATKRAAARARAVKEGPVADAFADLAREAKGTPPAELPEDYQRQIFAERLERGAQEMPWAQRRGASVTPATNGRTGAPAEKPPLAVLDPEAQAVSDFEAMLRQNGKAPASKVGATDVERPLDILRRAVEQATKEQQQAAKERQTAARQRRAQGELSEQDKLDRLRALGVPPEKAMAAVLGQRPPVGAAEAPVAEAPASPLATIRQAVIESRVPGLETTEFTPPTSEPAVPARTLPGQRAARPEVAIQAPESEAPMATPAQSPLATLKAAMRAVKSVPGGEALLEQVRTERRTLGRAAHTDELTGLGNQRAWARAKDTAEADPNARIVRFDVNGTKAVNDRLGHEAGDAVIRTAAAAVREAAAGEPVFRSGVGDEITAVVHGATPEEAEARAAAVRDAAERAYGVQDHAEGVRSSLSGGVGNTEAEADKAAYARKGEHKAAQRIAGRATAPTGESEPGTRATPFDVGPRELPPLPTGAPRETNARLLNPTTFDQSPAIQQQLANAEASMEARGVTKTRVPIAEGRARVRQMTRDWFVEQGMNPTNIDPVKVGRLSGEEIVAMKEQATQSMDQIAAVSKELENPSLTANDREQLEHLMGRLIDDRDALLEKVVHASSEKGRDLNFLRQMANRSLDPDAWVLQARRVAGGPLSDSVIAEIRKLARETMEACA